MRALFPVARIAPPIACAVALALACPELAPAASADEPPCDATERDYSVAANLRLSDTLMGAGDGIYRIGPGKLTLRWGKPDERGQTPVKLVAYSMQDTFTVVSKALFWTTRAENHTHSKVTPDRCGVAAEGTFAGRTLRWTGQVRGYRSDGTVTCEGSFCGKFGAPREGTSDVHTGAHPVTFAPFEFDPSTQTFTMAYSVVQQTSSPSQTSAVSLGGRELRRACVPVVPCP